MSTIQSEILKTRQHFEILDGMRGIAALSVVIFHFMEMTKDLQDVFIAHGFLAVDFFFCLSGFVIAYAYDNRMHQIGIKEFFKSRLIRLQPLVILGSFFGLLTYLFDPFVSISNHYTINQNVLIFITSLLVIPFPIISERSFNLFGLNAPAWSLFWEYIANILYAIFFCKLHRKTIAICTILAAIMLCYTSYNAQGSLLGGWSKDNFWDGGARIAYSFLAGMLIFRYNLILQSKIGFLPMCLLLFLAFIVPYNIYWNWLSEPIIVILYFPLLISIGAGAKLTPTFKKICDFSGQISYPLYMTHYAFIWMFLNYITQYQPNANQINFIIIIGTILLIALAYITLKLYDIPIRKYLKNKRNV